jgi:hypothetical protein
MKGNIMKMLYIAGIVSMMAFPAFAEKTLVDIKPEKVEMMPVAECKNIIRAMNSEKKPGVKNVTKPVKNQMMPVAECKNIIRAMNSERLALVKPDAESVKNHLINTNLKKVYK